MTKQDSHQEAEVYSLDLDEESTEDQEAVFREAVQAIERQSEAQSASVPLEAVSEPSPLEKDASDPAGETVEDVGLEAAPGELTRLKAEMADLHERYLRTLADFENYRKRSERERDELKRYAVAESLQEFLAVVDNLERAVSSTGPSDDLRTGVEMILRQVQDLLERFGGQEVKAMGEVFDPSFHEAMTRQEDPTVEVPTVIEVLQRGYRLHQRLLRPARVRVAMPVETAAPRAGVDAEPTSGAFGQD